VSDTSNIYFCLSESIFVYYNRDGVAGFQPDYTTAATFDCSTPGTGDCLDVSLLISLSSLNWTQISAQKFACPSGFPVNCSVYVFSTTGYQAAVSTNTPVITFTLKLATHPLRVDNVLITPEYSKIDVSVWYPWANSGANANASVGLHFVGAGRVAGGILNNVTSTVIGGVQRTGLFFNASASASAAFAWDGTANVKVGSQSAVVSGVVVHGITGDAVLGLSFPFSAIASCAITYKQVACQAYYNLLLDYHLDVSTWQAFSGWKVQYLFFSWADLQPTSVEWDPVVGNTSPAPAPAPAPSNSGPTTPTSSSPVSPTTSGVSVLTSSVVLVVGALLALIRLF